MGKCVDPLPRPQIKPESVAHIRALPLVNPRDDRARPLHVIWNVGICLERFFTRKKLLHHDRGAHPYLAKITGTSEHL